MRGHVVCSLARFAVRCAPSDLVWRTRLSANASIPSTIVWSSPVARARARARLHRLAAAAAERVPDAATASVAFNASVGGYVDSSAALAAPAGARVRASARAATSRGVVALVRATTAPRRGPRRARRPRRLGRPR